MTKVLVTGGAGFIGTNLVKELLQQGRQVVVLDNLSTGKKENIPEQVEFYEGDIGDKELVQKALQDVETVFHLGSCASVVESVEDPAGDFINNVLGTINLLDRMKEQKCKRILFASSSTVYGKNQLPMHEGLLPNPISPYATGKRTVELLLNNYCELARIIPTCFRIFNAYGPYQDLDNPKQGITGYIIGAALKQRLFKVHGKGDQERDYVFVDDITEIFIKAEKDPKTYNQIINIGSGEKITLLELIKRVEQATGKQIELQYGEPYRTCDVKSFQADITKLRETLGITPSTNMHENLLKTIDWAKTQI